MGNVSRQAIMDLLAQQTTAKGLAIAVLNDPASGMRQICADLCANFCVPDELGTAVVAKSLIELFNIHIEMVARQLYPYTVFPERRMSIG